MNVKKLPKMREEEINQLIKEQFLCRIAFRGDLYPYIAPFQYVVINDNLYFHFTGYGKKIDFLKQDTPVCVEIEKYSQNLSEYAFIILQGKLKLVNDPLERKAAIEKIANEGKKRLSENFLLAHGFSSASKWTNFSEEKPLIIVKLDPVVEKTGLKSE
jgi:uncharacterized protein